MFCVFLTTIDQPLMYENCLAHLDGFPLPLRVGSQGRGRLSCYVHL